MDPTQKSLTTQQNLVPIDNTDPCVHCGFCLPTCASYRVLGTEMDSPRGRIHILKAIDNNELTMDPTIAHHFDTCLGCYACVSACPSGVKYDQLIEAVRPQLNQGNLRNSCQKILRNVLLSFLPYPNRLRAILTTLRTYSGSHVQKIMRKIGLTGIFGKELQAMEALLPQLADENFQDNFKVINKAFEKKRGRVGLVLGCVQRCFDPEVNKATLSVLQANGFEVVIPKNQGCCGAVTHHQGEMDSTIVLAKQLVQSFNDTIEGLSDGNKEELDAILIAASGCGHTMKAYKNLLDKRHNFSSPVFDVHEFLFKEGFSESFLERLKPLTITGSENNKLKLPITVTYHDACHMIHGQQISQEPRKLLERIPELLLVECKEAGVCCGSAGIYNLLQPDIANELGAIKVKDLEETNAEIIASANIGCTLQIRRHLESNLKVMHPMQLLAKSANI